MKKALRLFAFSFRRELIPISAWIGLITAYNLFNIYLFEVYGDQSSIAEVYRDLPPVWQNVFGEFFISVNSLEGWLGTQFFSFLPLLLAAGLIILSSSVFSRQVEDLSVHNVLVQPVSRTAVFFSYALVPAAALLCFYLVNVPATLLAARTTGASPLFNPDVVRLYTATFLFSFFLYSTGVAVSVLLDSQKRSIGVFLGSVLILFILNAVLLTLGAMPVFRKLNPFYYFDCSRFLRAEPVPVGGLIYWLGGGAVATGVAALRFSRRDFKG